MAHSKRITLRLLLEHMQNGQRGQREDMKSLRYDVSLFKTEFRSLKEHLYAFESRITIQIENIGKRLDDIELEFLPRRVRKLERAVFGR